MCWNARRLKRVKDKKQKGKPVERAAKIIDLVGTVELPWRSGQVYICHVIARAMIEMSFNGTNPELGDNLQLPRG